MIYKFVHTNWYLTSLEKTQVKKNKSPLTPRYLGTCRIYTDETKTQQKNHIYSYSASLRTQSHVEWDILEKSRNHLQSETANNSDVVHLDIRWGQSTNSYLEVRE